MLPQYFTQLSGQTRAANGQPTPLLVEWFKMEPDLSIFGGGKDLSGAFNISGRVLPGGEASYVMTYANHSIHPLYFQGQLGNDASLRGRIVQGTGHQNLSWDIELSPGFKFWSGTWTDEGGRERSLEQCFTLGGVIYGFGKRNNEVYIVKGRFDGIEAVEFCEFCANQAISQKNFSGKYLKDGANESIEGFWTSPSGEKGSFKLKLQQQLPSADVPPLIEINTKPAPATNTNSLPPIKKEQAKPDHPSNSTPNNPPNFSPPFNTIPNITAPQFNQNYNQHQSSLHPGMQYYGMQSQYNPFQQLSYNHQHDPNAVLDHNINISFTPVNKVVDSYLVGNVENMHDIGKIMAEVNKGKKIEASDVLMFYGLCKDNALKTAFTTSCSAAVINLTPQMLFEFVKKNACSEVQLCIVQAFAYTLAGRIPPNVKKDIIDTIAFVKEQQTVKAILSAV